MVRLAKVAALAAVIALVAAACSSSSGNPSQSSAPAALKKGGVFRIGLASDVHEALDQVGLRPDVVSGGSTPTITTAHEIEGLTEIRPGTYAYNDRITQQTGACSWDDCALTVLATAIAAALALRHVRNLRGASEPSAV